MFSISESEVCAIMDQTRCESTYVNSQGIEPWNVLLPLSAQVIPSDAKHLTVDT